MYDDVQYVTNDNRSEPNRSAPPLPLTVSPKPFLRARQVILGVPTLSPWTSLAGERVQLDVQVNAVNGVRKESGHRDSNRRPSNEDTRTIRERTNIPCLSRASPRLV